MVETTAEAFEVTLKKAEAALKTTEEKNEASSFNKLVEQLLKPITYSLPIQLLKNARLRRQQFVRI